MNRRLERDVREWLDAERMSADEPAEQALVRAFAELGRRAPGAGFADRVLLRTGHFAPASAFWRSRWVRAAVIACMAAGGLAIITLPVWWLVAEPLARAFGSPLALAMSRGAARSMSAAFASWTVIQDVGSALRASLVTAPVLALLSANALLAAASLFGLKRLLKAPEELMP
jgi:hypothetical protein